MNRKFIWILAIALTITSIGQIVLAIIFYRHEVSIPIRNTGWVFIWISAIFGWLPMATFRKHGKVAKGKSYMLTTKLVAKGVYSIVRHPSTLQDFYWP